MPGIEDERRQGGQQSLAVSREQNRGRPAQADAAEGGDQTQEPLIPAVSLPSGGGALRNIGEKFSANAFAGSGGVSVPIPLSPARSLTPAMTLSYASGSGNGPFGLGWRASVPSISRKTDRGLPRYVDEPGGPEAPDVFLLSEAEDLVPILVGDDTNGWDLELIDRQNGFRITAYRPRVEGGFARIERWVDASSGETHWRTWSRANVLSIFGLSPQARIAAPGDPTRVFRWLLEETRDDKGNVVQFEYKREDLEGVDTSAPEERERLAEQTEQAQRYLKRVRYGNANAQAPFDFRFEVVLDYGEHADDPGSAYSEATNPWDVRQDTFSTFRSGFDIRTRRLCRRVLMFHIFPELGGAPRLVREVRFGYEGDGIARRLSSVEQRGHAPAAGGTFDTELYPPVEFGYVEPKVSEQLRYIDRDSLEGVPGAIDGSGFRLVDLDGEGLPGVLSQQGRALWYKSPLGDGSYGPSKSLPTAPSTANLATQSLLDLDGDGRRSLATLGGTAPGFFDRTSGALAVDEDWQPFRPLRALPQVDLSDPAVQLVDLDGDGLADILVTETSRFIWYPSKGSDGFGEPRAIARPSDERSGPALIYRDPKRAIFYADMTGDGLTDIVRVENGSVTYWPNTGYGRFGRAITMRNGPRFDRPDMFRTDRLRFGDTDGSGTADIVYVGPDVTRLFRNESGNAFSAPVTLDLVPPVDSAAFVELSDILGSGSASLVWSTQLPSRAGRQVAFLDLAADGKPYLLNRQLNNMGLEVRVRYAPSTRYYLEDKAAGKPWRTRLPFPVQVVDRVEALDRIAGHLFATEYRYRHGYFDGPEREFRGFGYVESRNVEVFSDYADAGLFDPTFVPAPPDAVVVPPVVTKTWFHTGAYIGLDRLSDQYAEEYFASPEIELLPDTPPPKGPGSAGPLELSGAEAREAVRALKGRALRSEIYADDGTSVADKPYSVTEANFAIVRLQPKADQAYASFFVHDRESRAYSTERNETDLRLVQSATLRVDEVGNVLRSASVAYGRLSTPVPEQGESLVVASEASVANSLDPQTAFRLGVPLEAKSFELSGDSFAASAPASWEDLESLVESAVETSFDQVPVLPGQKRLLTHSRQIYYTDDLTGPLPLGSVGVRALPFRSESLAFNQQTLDDGLGGNLSDTSILTIEGGYVAEGTNWWVVSGRAVFDPLRFYLPTQALDPFGNPPSIVSYDQSSLLVESSTDALGNTVLVQNDYRVLAPWEVTDPNGNRSQVRFDARGMVVATAVMGKTSETVGDTLDNPTTELTYDLLAWMNDGAPAWVKTRARETHFADSPTSLFQESYAYSSGAGAVIMTKVQAEPGLAAQRDGDGNLVLDQNDEPILVDTTPDLRWIGNGRTIVDNRGNPVKQYEPYFSSIPDYEDEAELVEQGVTPVLRYDPLGRLVRTDLPNQTYSKVEFTPWESVSYDPNDTAADPAEPSGWYTTRINYVGSDPEKLSEKRAAELTAHHQLTPTRVVFDALGRTVRSYAHNGFDGGGPGTGTPILFETRSVLDVQGNVLRVIDARGNVAEERAYGQLGQVLSTTSVDAGSRWAVAAVDGQPLRTWDSRSQTFRSTYDQLRRPVDQYVAVGANEQLLQRSVYGELASAPEASNHRGRVYGVFDGAGYVRSEQYDFKGNLLRSSRTLTLAKTGTPDWQPISSAATIPDMESAAAPLLETASYGLQSTFDALNRVGTATSPDASVVSYGYQRRGLLGTVDLRHRGASVASPVVQDLDYDVKGRREKLILGNGVTTSYLYDLETFRVERIETLRTSDGAKLQGLRYHYDPVGNVVEIVDDAQQTIYFSNSQADPRARFEYDPNYRLILAEGREHVSISSVLPTQSDVPTIGAIPDPSDPDAVVAYTELYAYDQVGNILEMRHLTGGSVGSGWTRRYNHDTEGNRLWSTSQPTETSPPTYTNSGPQASGQPPAQPPQYSDRYEYDSHGNMTSMPHVASMAWNALDELELAVVGSTVNHYQYGGGQRVRKFIERNSGSTTTDERIYIGPFEVYRRSTSSGLQEEIESVHVSDDTGRILLLETKTHDGGTVVPSPLGKWRYQLSNHLGSASTELDETGQVISYEEYHPYGTTAYRAADSQTEVSAKRYRYTGKEKDEETGLYYHGARYYACWLGRWTAADPIGLGDGVNRFAYVSGSPVTFHDPNGARKKRSAAQQVVDAGRSYIDYKVGRFKKDAAFFAKGAGYVRAFKDAQIKRIEEIEQTARQTTPDLLVEPDNEVIAGGSTQLKRSIEAGFDVIADTLEAPQDIVEGGEEVVEGITEGDAEKTAKGVVKGGLGLATLAGAAEGVGAAVRAGKAGLRRALKKGVKEGLEAAPKAVPKDVPVEPTPRPSKTDTSAGSEFDGPLRMKEQPLPTKRERLFDLEPKKRGVVAESREELLPGGRGDLPFNYPVIDQLPATSVTTVDLEAKSFQTASGLRSRIKQKATALERFEAPEGSQKVLRVGVPDDVVPTSEQEEVMRDLARKFEARGVNIVYVPIN